MSKKETTPTNPIKVLTGKVLFAGINNDGKHVTQLEITDELSKKLVERLQLKGIEDGMDSNPIKIDDEGVISFRSYSKFKVPIFVNSEEQLDSDEDATKITDIGQDSVVQISFKLEEIAYPPKRPRSHHQVAYLQSINVIDLVPFERYNAFEDSEVEEFE